MYNVSFRSVTPSFERSFAAPQEVKAAKVNNTPVTNLSGYTAENVKANFLPSLFFTGIHKDSVLGIETRVAGISQYQNDATRLKFRFINRNKRHEPQKIPLHLEAEPQNLKDKNAIAVYHEYEGKKMKIGYLPASLSAVLKPLMDDDLKFDASVINVAGGKGSRVPNVGVRIRLEYLSNPDRSPNDKTIKRVKKAFAQAIKDGSALSYREEKIIKSKQYGRATKMKLDDERKEATVYRAGCRVEIQLRVRHCARRTRNDLHWRVSERDNGQNQDDDAANHKSTVAA